jgi:LmbE family N-acetylglucosaminyl deacetylase
MLSRRKLIQSIGLAATGFATADRESKASQMPGRPAAAESGQNPATPSSIMAIAAHPGDAFFSMGLPVAVQTHLGARGAFLSLTAGEKGSRTVAPPDYGGQQRAAGERAAEMMAATAVTLDYPDGELPHSDDVKLATCDLIRKYRPDVIVTHWSGSWHKDHRASHEIVLDAVFYAALPALARKDSAHSVRKVLFADNWEDATGFSGDTYLDVSPVFDHWTEACAVFPMWRGETGFRYRDYYTSLAIARGCLGGFNRAVALMSAPEQLMRKLTAL